MPYYGLFRLYYHIPAATMAAGDEMKANVNVAIVGLGYVGLPLALQFARSDTTVLGLDVDEAKVKAINDGRSYIKHIEAAAIAREVKAGRFSVSTDFSKVKEVEAVIICVPTPL